MWHTRHGLWQNCLQRLIWWPKLAIIITLKSTMNLNLTHKNQGFYYNSGGRIKSWNFGSVPIVIIHILKNPVNSYDSNGVIAVPISTLGDEKWNLPFFCLPILPWNPLNVLGHIICRWNCEKWFRIDGEIPEISFTNLNLRGEWSLNP